MAKCAKCNTNIGFLGVSNYCEKCREENARLKEDEEKKSQIQAKEAAELKRAAQLEKIKEERETKSRIEAIMLTTETAPNLNITKRIEIVTAECAFGMNIFKDLFAGVRDIVGGRSKAVQETMRDARKAALYELKVEAYEVGANAVVGVDLDYVELSSGSNMVMLVASGTAVVIDGQEPLKLTNPT